MMLDKFNIQLFGWDDIANDKSSDGNKDSMDYTKFPEGSTIIRVLDKEPYTRWTHWVQQANGGKGLGVTCIGKGCPICELISIAKANKEKPKYTSRKVHSMRIINRTTEKVEINEQGKTFYENLKNIMDEVGDVRAYDIKVIRKGTGINDTSYTLLPMKATGSFDMVNDKYVFKDFATEDKEKFDDTFSFTDLYNPPTQEQVLAILEGKPLNEIFTSENKTDEDIEVDFTK